MIPGHDYEKLFDHQDEPLKKVLTKFYAGDDAALRDHIDALKKSCTFLNYKPGPDVEKKAKYALALAHAAIDKIFEAYKVSRDTGGYPEFRISYKKDLEPAFEKFVGSKPGSPQDVLYTFVSERAPGWIDCLTQAGFHSACMSGEGEAIFTTSFRLLNINNPDLKLNELPGAIPSDFYKNLAVMKQTLCPVADFVEFAQSADLTTKSPEEKWEAKEVASLLVAAKANPGFLQNLANLIEAEYTNEKGVRILRWNKHIKSKIDAKGQQEQLVLKYINEAKLLQKLLGGTLVDHVASNVKMQTNPLRGNKVEVDSIYGIIGGDRPGLVLIEAKEKPQVSITQLYAQFEAFRFRIPATWDLHVIAALLSDTPDALIIDMLQVDFKPEYAGSISESLFNYEISKHYRWEIAKLGVV